MTDDPRDAASAYEYRIRWKRAGMRPATDIRQTEAGAMKKAAALRWSDRDARVPDEVIDGYRVPSAFAEMPPIEYIRIFRRRVEGWEEVPFE